MTSAQYFQSTPLWLPGLSFRTMRTTRTRFANSVVAFTAINLFCHYGSTQVVPHGVPHTPVPMITTSCSLSSQESIPSELIVNRISNVRKQDFVEDLRHDQQDSTVTSSVHVPIPNPNDCDASLPTAEVMKAPKQKATIGILSTLITYVSINSWFKTTHPEAFIWSDEDREEASWIATSKSWFDRKACRWLSVCGGAHLQFAGNKFGHRVQNHHQQSSETPNNEWDWENAWYEGHADSENWTSDERIVREIPSYVLDYAPLVHLYSGEQYWPCDIAEHLYHITPRLNYTPLQSESLHPTLSDLNDLNKWGPRWVFLTSNDDPEARPPWLEGEKNIPDEPVNPDDDFADNEGWVHHPGRTYYQGLKNAVDDMKEWFGVDRGSSSDNDRLQSDPVAQTEAQFLEHQREQLHSELKRHEAKEETLQRRRGGRSDAPAVLVVVDKGHDVIDAFWFFFYSFNLGNVVFNVRFGNHVGDWEHTAIRFHKGKPKAVFFSEHNFGSAYSYDAVEKIGRRPIIYSATGTHAMYATPGAHPYVLPWGILHDQTDRGPLWDPALNSHAYTYDFRNDVLRSSNLTPKAPTEWFDFAGHWGDKFYPLGDRRQYRFAGQYKYVNGPLGPKFKNLGRKKICGGPDREPCVIKHWLGGENRMKRIHANGEDDID